MANANDQPSKKFEELLDKLMDNTPEEITFRGKKKKIGWLHNRTIRRFTHIMYTDDTEKRNAKLCACILTNDVFAWFQPLAYFFLWVWYRYVIDIDDKDVLSVINASKKKIQYYQSQLVTTLSTGMRDTMMQMTRAEAEAIQAEHDGAQPTA